MVPLFRIHVSCLFCLNLKPLHFGAFYTLVLAHPSASLVCQYFLFIRIQVNNSPCGETNSLVTLLIACRRMYLLKSETEPSWRGDRHFGCQARAHNHRLVPLQNSWSHPNIDLGQSICFFRLLIFLSFVYFDLCQHTPYFYPCQKLFLCQHISNICLCPSIDFLYVNCDLCQYRPYFCPCISIDNNYNLCTLLSISITYWWNHVSCLHVYTFGSLILNNCLYYPLLGYIWPWEVIWSHCE